MSNINAKNIAGYVLLPGIIPRLAQLFTSGFGYIAFLMAQIYAMVRLLPAGHAYTNPQNIGQFNIRQVIAQAAYNLELDIKNLDQLLIFFALLFAIVLLGLQFALLIFSLIFEPALAAFPTSAFPIGSSIFETAQPTNDIAFMLLDQVFGIPDLYGSCIAQGITCDGSTATPGAFPWPFHTALQQMFRFYSTGILIIGAMIFFYFVVIVIGETAVTGTPFGQRFQNVWVPIRLIMAIGLLVPLNHGLNAGQYITLYAAKYGSGFATNTWTTYMNTIASDSFYSGGAGANPTGERESLIGKPNTPDMSSVVQTMSIIHSCTAAHWLQLIDRELDDLPPDHDKIQPFLVKQPIAGAGNTDPMIPVTAGTTYTQALEFFNNSDIIIRFGENADKNADGTIDSDEPSEGANEKGFIIPHCGDIRITITQAQGNSAATAIQEYYFNLIRNSWFEGASGTLPYQKFAFRFATITDENNTDQDGLPSHPCRWTDGEVIPATAHENTPNDECSSPPVLDWRDLKTTPLQSATADALNTVWTDYALTNADGMIEMSDDILQRGWAGAGIWYNKIAQINGAYMQAAMITPNFDQYPAIMKKVREAHGAANNLVGLNDIYCPYSEGDQALQGLDGDDIDIANTMCAVMKYWSDGGFSLRNPELNPTGSPFEDAMHMLFGTRSMSALSNENVTTHPLAQLAMTGRGLVEAAIRNVAVSAGASVVGGLSRAIGNVPANMIQAVTGFISSTAFVGLTAGLVLYYVVPFLPFIYFFFAVSSWIKSIFEAMVGTPLWALAHLRIDGEGLPGTSASNGYFLILEIFLRPVLSVFGLVAATLIFTAQVRVLNFMWSLVTDNLTGYDDALIGLSGTTQLVFKRSIIDEFFFTIIFAIVVYMMALAAFKLIDKIPDNLLRWSGNQVSSFGDINQDSVDSLTKYVALGGNTVGRPLAEGAQQLAGESSTAIGGLFARLRQGI